jgi:NAD(P)-dependent dehydrogenase (short-subunit alcohol dehydrogenase family)
MTTLKSKGVAIVTGSAQGIGQGIALRLAQDGYDLALFDIPPKQSILEDFSGEIGNELGRKVITVVGDVSVEADVEGLVVKTLEVFGGLDVVSCKLDLFHTVDADLEIIDGCECRGPSFNLHHRK